MRIGRGQNYIELSLQEVLPAHLPCPGDASIAFAASIYGYSSANSCWVDAAAFKAFLAATHDLATGTSHDPVRMEGLSPRELTLVIRPADDTESERLTVEFSCARLYYPEIACMSGTFDIERATLAAVEKLRRAYDALVWDS